MRLELGSDIRFALRAIRRAPATFLVAALSIAIGIGANTTVYTWLDGLVLRPLPAVPDADRLVAFNWAPADGAAGGVPPFSYPAFREWQAASQAFDGMAAYGIVRVTLRVHGSEQPQPAWGQLVTANYFEVVGVRALLGRTLRPDEEQRMAPVVVLSEPFWRRRFGGSPAVLGMHLSVNGADLTVVGVAAAKFVGVTAGLGFDLWIPLTQQPYLIAGGNALADRSQAWLRGVGRLKPGLSVATAGAELHRIARERSAAAGERPVTGASVQRFRDQQLGSLLFPLLTAVLAVTGLVLLLACANVATLLMVRAAGRRRELGVRLALGATRWRMVRQLLTESALLAVVGGGLALLFTGLVKGSFSVFIPPVPEPVAYTLALSPPVVAFAAIATLLTALLFGLVPALEGSRPELVTALRTQGTGGRRGARLRAVLAGGQLVFSVVALAAAGLFLRSLDSARRTDLGFADPAHLLLVGTDLNQARLEQADAVSTLDAVLARLRALPGVAAAAATTSVPLGFGGHLREQVEVDGYSAAADEDMKVERVSVTPGYFEAMGIPILRGRGVAEPDQAAALRVAVVNESFVRRFWPGLDPVGRRLRQGPGWATVVGVARDGRYDSPAAPSYPLVYTALSQWFRPALTFVVRTQQEPRALVEPARAALLAGNGDLPFLDPRSMAEHLQASTFVQQLGGTVLGWLGALALLMAALGLYAVIASGVAEGTREIGIRIALGATVGTVRRAILARTLRIVAAGLGLGLLLALGVGTLFRSQLVGVDPADPVTFGVVAVLLAATGVLASWLPARRASRVDPVQALTAE